MTTVDIDRARELADLEAIDKLTDGPFELVQEGYNWELDGPDDMWSDDKGRNAKLEYHLAYLQFWTDPMRCNHDIRSVYQLAERIAYHNSGAIQIILENLKNNGINLEIK